jgi:hypothetical protein
MEARGPGRCVEGEVHGVSVAVSAGRQELTISISEGARATIL